MDSQQRPHGVAVAACLAIAIAGGAALGQEQVVTPYEQNPRYLAVDGTPVFAIGATHRHSWVPISRPNEFDLYQDLDRLAAMVERVGSEHVRGFVRLIPYDPINHLHDGEVERVLQPWQRLEDGRFDLEQFDGEWEQRLREFLDAARERSIVVSLEVWDDWSVTRGVGGAWDPGEGAAWNGHPFNPQNNVNYDEDVLPTTTTACVAPFYRTLPDKDDLPEALALQQHYVDHLAEIAGGYPNVLWNLSNETRAPLAWSRYWAEYLRQALPEGRLIGEMPSTNRRDGGGECDHELNALTLATDDRYDFVDVAQGVSRHEFGGDPVAQAVQGAQRIHAYQQAMAEHGRLKPLVVSKDYSADGPVGLIVHFSRFTGGAATSRFHRPYGDADFERVPEFQYETAERLARFVGRTEFWNMQPTPGLLESDHDRINILGDEGREYVLHLVGERDEADLALNLVDGRWNIAMYDPHQRTWIEPGGESGATHQARADGPTRLATPAHPHSLLLHLRRENE